MSTKGTVAFTTRDGDVMAAVYLHNAGLIGPEYFGQFFEDVARACPEPRDCRFWDPSYLAAKFVVWSLLGAINVTGTAVITDPERWHAHRRFTVRCHAEPSAAHPEVTEEGATARLAIPEPPPEAGKVRRFRGRDVEAVCWDRSPEVLAILGGWGAEPVVRGDALRVWGSRGGYAGALQGDWLVRDREGAARYAPVDFAAAFEAPADGDATELADVREQAEFYEAERDRERLAAEHHRTACVELEAELADVRGHVKALAEVEASATAAERDRIRAAVEALKFTLFRPGNGPAQTQALDVVPLEALLGVLEGGPA